MANTRIAWADQSWNPITGCSRQCPYCYARRMAGRHLPQGQFADKKRTFEDVRFHSERLMLPLVWKKPARIFVDSMGDLFDKGVEWEWFYRIVQVMLNAPWHTFLVLTKCVEQMEQFVNSRDIARLVYGRKSDHIVWCISAENQKAYDMRLPHLAQLKWGKRGVSLEPMCGPVNLGLLGTCPEDWGLGYTLVGNRVDWVICGAMSGAKRLPMKLEWAQALRAECQASKVAFFMKQMDIGGKVTDDVNLFPENLQVREWPA